MAMYLQDAQRQKDDVETFLITPPLAESTLENLKEICNLTEEQYCLRQLWTLVKIIRTARRSCRSNAAMYSYLKTLFPYADFRDVPKDNKWGSGLQITIKLPDGSTVSDDTIGDLGNGEGSEEGHEHVRE